MSKRAPALAFLFLAACTSPSASVATGPIVDGSPAPDEDAVVSVIGVGFCSGTLIAPRLVLTAKHCVVAEDAPGPIAASGVRVGIGPEWFVTTASYHVEAILTTPGPLVISLPPNPVTGATGTDIALLVLTEEVVGVTPIPVYREDPTALAGTMATAIGYGRTRTSDGGEKNEVTTTITRLTPFLVEAVQTICQGDSGGPLLTGTGADRAVIGVASFGVFSALAGDVPCPAEHDYWNRVDAQMALIDRALIRSGACVANEEETCNALDDDCDGAVDETCAGLGEACASDADCALGPLPADLAADYAGRSVHCAAADGASVCTLSCDALSPRSSCASIEEPFRTDVVALDGWVCGHADGCEGVCVRSTSDARAEGAACALDGECASARCEAGACRTACAGGHGICPSGEVCLAETDACGVCAAPEARPSGRGRGEPCSAASECSSGACVDGLCSLPCSTSSQCGPDFRCAEEYCRPGTAGASGDPCEVDADCGSSASCVTRGGGPRFCARACPSSGRCTTGECVMIDESSYCVPDGAVVGEACTSTSDCARSECVDGECALACGEAGSSCTAGLACVRSDDGVGAYCTPPAPAAAGGCSCAVVGGSPSDASSVLLLLGLLGLALRRSRPWIRSSRR
jgi:V8-like Glu-specific endopeptidase